MSCVKIPPGARHLRTYADFRSYLADFADGIYPFLWIVGRPGLGKTESIRQAVRGRQVYFQKGGQLTPLQFYLDCYEHRNQPIILDATRVDMRRIRMVELACQQRLADEAPHPDVIPASTTP